MVGIAERENTPISLSEKASGVHTPPKWGSKLKKKKKKEDMDQRHKFWHRVVLKERSRLIVKKNTGQV